MLTTERGVRVFGVTTNDSFGAADKVIVIPCAGMAQCVGNVAYTAAPAGGPTIEYGNNGLNWDAAETVGADAKAAVGITLYSWAVQLQGYKFIRLTIPQPGALGTARGSAKLLTKSQI